MERNDLINRLVNRKTVSKALLCLPHLLRGGPACLSAERSSGQPRRRAVPCPRNTGPRDHALFGQTRCAGVPAPAGQQATPGLTAPGTLSPQAAVPTWLGTCSTSDGTAPPPRSGGTRPGPKRQ